MTDDIVARLRTLDAVDDEWVHTCALEAADEIERLQNRETDLLGAIRTVVRQAKERRAEIKKLQAIEAEKDETIRYLLGQRERLRARITLLEGFLSGALDVVERFAACDTTEARAALKETGNE